MEHSANDKLFNAITKTQIAVATTLVFADKKRIAQEASNTKNTFER